MHTRMFVAGLLRLEGEGAHTHAHAYMPMHMRMGEWACACSWQAFFGWKVRARKRREVWLVQRAVLTHRFVKWRRRPEARTMHALAHVHASNALAEG